MKKTAKSAGIVFCTMITGMFLFGMNVRAYIDPSVTTYLIQAVAGIVIAIGAVAGIYFRRAKKKVSEKLGIDENRNKIVETDDIIFMPDEPSENTAENKSE